MRQLLFFVDVPERQPFMGWVTALDVPRVGDRVCLYDESEETPGPVLVAEWEGTVTQVRHDIASEEGVLAVYTVRVHVLADAIPNGSSYTQEDYAAWLSGFGWEGFDVDEPGPTLTVIRSPK